MLISNFSLNFICITIRSIAKHIYQAILWLYSSNVYFMRITITRLSSGYGLIIFTVPGSSVGLSILTDSSFNSLESKVCELTLKGIADMGFTHMTEIQKKTIPHLLEGR